ncbi:hypothetical protein CENSYa_0172 [Cenarchaeum symbiosum A]|uniref:Uncharacterized protein n=1 Tax=Cenarchaeum symbiosum (strain A) TaxID=414004 RepID=A0RU00_CENSY|nr:hypothetical protein CENSYa_0172 [Cenarchaeum symbiosum A]
MRALEHLACPKPPRGELLSGSLRACISVSYLSWFGVYIMARGRRGRLRRGPGGSCRTHDQRAGMAPEAGSCPHGHLRSGDGYLDFIVTTSLFPFL